jgi:uncharacterized protein
MVSAGCSVSVDSCAVHRLWRWPCATYAVRSSAHILPWRVGGPAGTLRMMTMQPLSHADAVRRIVAAEAEIRSFGVRRLALFGSVLRNEARADSDVDLLVEFAPGEKTFDHFMGLALFLEDLLKRRVELLTPESLSPYIGPHILKAAKDVLRAA